MENIGERIKNIRLEKGLSLKELGHRIDIDSAHLSRIENGKKKANIELLEKMSRAMDVDISDFFGEKGEVPKELENYVDWIIFGKDMEKKNLTPDQIRTILEIIDSLPKT